MIISIPLCLNGFLTNILGTMATLIIPRRLILAGFTHSESLSLIGKYTGMAATMLTIPLIVVSTINTLLIPDLSQTMNSGQNYKASIRIKKVIKLAFLLGLSTTIICNIVPTSLGIMFYNRDDLGLYIRFVSLAAPVFFTSAAMFGILNGLNRQGIILRNSLIEALIELVCLFIFTAIPSINIYGYSIAMILATGVSFALNFYEVKKHIDIEINYYNVAIYLLLGFLTFLVIKILSLHLFINNYILNNLIVIASTFLIFVYLGTFGENN